MRQGGKKRNPLNMMGEDTMIMIGDSTDYQTGTLANNMEKSTLHTTEVPLHMSRPEVT